MLAEMAGNSELHRTLTALKSTGGHESESIILQTLGDSTDQRIQQFYEKSPYHNDARNKPLAARIERLRRDWASWATPVVLDGRRSLDVGCGCGDNLLLHAALAKVAVGVDLSLAALREAERRAQAAGLADRLYLIRQDIKALDLPAASFDVITCVGVLHHIDDPSAALARMAYLLEPGGVLLLGVYHRGGRRGHRLRRRLVSLLGRSVEDRAWWAERLFDVRTEARRFRVPERIYVRDAYAVPVEHGFTATDLLRELNRHHLELVDVKPSPSIPFPAKIETRLRTGINDETMLMVDRILTRTRREHFWSLARRRHRETGGT